jgi:hypothetical protein
MEARKGRVNGLMSGRLRHPPWRRQLQADFIFEHVRRRIDFYVQRAPQGDPHRRVVWRRHLLVIHAGSAATARRAVSLV